jgi:hypothetical protein
MNVGKGLSANIAGKIVSKTLTYDSHILPSCSSESLGPLDLSGVSLHPEEREKTPGQLQVHTRFHYIDLT